MVACHIFRPAGPGRRKAETLDTAKYVEIIEEECVPKLKEINPMFPGTLRGMWWQQDGAGNGDYSKIINQPALVLKYVLEGPHRGEAAKNCLRRLFGERTFGLGLAGVIWPPTSAFLAVCDFWSVFEKSSPSSLKKGKDQFIYFPMSHRLNAELKKRVRMDRSAEGWPEPTNLQELEERIRFEVSRLTPAEIRRACMQGMAHRVAECIANDGRDTSK